MIAQGNALGIGAYNKPKALKGRHSCLLFLQLYVRPYRPYDVWSYPLPRALPWAAIFKPFGLNNIIHIATKGGRSLNAWAR